MAERQIPNGQKSVPFTANTNNTLGLKREEHAEMMSKAWEQHFPEKAQIEQAAIDELKALDTLTRNVGGYCDIEIAQCEQGLQSAGRVED